MAQQTTAPKAYAAAQRDIARLIEILQGELERHADGHRDNPRDWGRVGDLGKVRSDLKQAVGFISGFEPGDVERAIGA